MGKNEPLGGYGILNTSTFAYTSTSGTAGKAKNSLELLGKWPLEC